MIFELNAGNAFDLTAKRIQTSYVTRRDSTKARGVHTVATADYRVTLKNATDSATTIDVRGRAGGGVECRCKLGPGGEGAPPPSPVSGCGCRPGERRC